MGRTFLQAESEIGAIQMVYGAAAAGERSMTASSSPGISLKQEGLSYLAGSELPCVVVDIMRGGPGLGNIAPEQSDYNQMVKGGGHGSRGLRGQPFGQRSRELRVPHGAHGGALERRERPAGDPGRLAAAGEDRAGAERLDQGAAAG